MLKFSANSELDIKSYVAGVKDDKDISLALPFSLVASPIAIFPTRLDNETTLCINARTLPFQRWHILFAEHQMSHFSIAYPLSAFDPRNRIQKKCDSHDGAQQECRSSFGCMGTTSSIGPYAFFFFCGGGGS